MFVLWPPKTNLPVVTSLLIGRPQDWQLGVLPSSMSLMSLLKIVMMMLIPSKMNLLKLVVQRLQTQHHLESLEPHQIFRPLLQTQVMKSHQWPVLYPTMGSHPKNLSFVVGSADGRGNFMVVQWCLFQIFKVHLSKLGAYINRQFVTHYIWWMIGWNARGSNSCCFTHWRRCSPAVGWSKTTFGGVGGLVSEMLRSKMI